MVSWSIDGAHALRVERAVHPSKITVPVCAPSVHVCALANGCLQGHDHKTDEEYAVMQAEEDRVLARIQQMNV